jgi:hypothetical protein
MAFTLLPFVLAFAGLTSLVSAFHPEAKSNVAIYYVGLSPLLWSRGLAS